MAMRYVKKMSISKLYIFKKDTDASAFIRGIEYQLLQSLHEWLQNFIAGNGETVYCEYDDDIAIFNSAASTIKFKQIKSYSENFSFKQKEVRKAILNFFMLYASPAYLQQEPSFNFETNAGVIKGTDDDNRFLAEWVEAQKTSITDEHIKKILLQIKGLIIQELTEQSLEEQEKIKSKIESLNSKKPRHYEEKIAQLEDQRIRIVGAVNYLTDLKDDVYIDFIRRISWTFHYQEPSLAITAITAKIEQLISTLPFNIEPEQIPVIFTVLRWEVSKQAIEPIPANRKLTTERLKTAILAAGEDKWYVELKAKFDSIDLSAFTLGTFFELRGAARHARFAEYLQDDIPFWIEKIKAVRNLKMLPDTLQRTAFYELCFLTFFTGTIDSYADQLKEFFGNVEDYKTSDELENSVVLLSIVRSANKLGRSSLDDALILQWKDKLIGLVEAELNQSNTANRNASLFDLRSEIAFQIELHDNREVSFKVGIENLKKVVALLNEANLFPLYKLSNRLTHYLNAFSEIDQKNIKDLEKLTKEVDQHLAKKDGSFSLAKANRDRAVMYFQKGMFVKAIEHFHKAKLYWFSDEGIKGTIIASILTSTSFNNLRLHYAAKYYGYAGAYLVTSSPELKDVERYFPRGLAMVAMSDYMAGAWISFFDNADIFFATHFELESEPLNIEMHEEYREVLFAAITIQYITDRLYPAFSAFVSFRMGRWQRIPADVMTALKKEVSTKLDTYDDKTLLEWLAGRVNQTPFNDAGKSRTVTWMAMGVQWTVKFVNNYLTTVVAEQFIAMLQIFQVEMQQEDLCIFKTKVYINIDYTDSDFKFEHDTTGGKHGWQVKIPHFDSTDKEKFRVHYFQQIALMQTMFNQISLLPADQNYSLFEQHVKDELGSKTTPASPYEKIYRQLVTEKLFNESQRGNFIFPDDQLLFPRQIDEISWKKGLSELYDPEYVKKAISSRYEKSLTQIHLTLERVRKNPSFQKTIAQLHAEGWKEWHILLAIHNAVLNYKCNVMIPSGASREDFATMHQKLSGKDEKETYLEIPLDVLSTENLKEQFKYLTPVVLRSYGLEHKAPFIEFDSIQEVLIKRFNFQTDDTEHNAIF
jgi:hypothetical protein